MKTIILLFWHTYITTVITEIHILRKMDPIFIESCKLDVSGTHGPQYSARHVETTHMFVLPSLRLCGQSIHGGRPRMGMSYVC